LFEDWQRKKEADDFCQLYGLDCDDICRWDAISKTLHGSQLDKARKFNRMHLISPGNNGVFFCLPIPGYNSTTYEMKKTELGVWTCNCQHNVQTGMQCSHILALMLYFNNLGVSSQGAFTQ